MAHVVKETKIIDDNDAYGSDVAEPTNIIARVVYIVGGVLLFMLALRFLLSLLGANRDNGFADFVYSVTYPFVAPFFGLFNYDPTYGSSRFEFETLIAMLVYGLVVWVIVRLVTVANR